MSAVFTVYMCCMGIFAIFVHKLYSGKLFVNLLLSGEVVSALHEGKVAVKELRAI